MCCGGGVSATDAVPPFIFTVYTFTDRELSVKTGMLNERFNLIKLFRIVDISVDRSFLQHLFGMSTLVLDTRDRSPDNGVAVLKNHRVRVQDASDVAGCRGSLPQGQRRDGP